jgi:hypothetical protein
MRRRPVITKTLNFFIGREDIIDLVREHTFGRGRIQAGCELLNRLRHPVPVTRHGGLHLAMDGRLGSPYRAGRSDHWLKIKNPDAPAMRRLEEEDWN